MTLEKINQYLDTHYGRIDPNYPRFRVVYSEDIKETRVITEETFSGLSVIRHEVMPKYPFLKNMHIFEIHKPFVHEEVVDQAGNYEPLYVFRDEKGRPLPLELEPCIFLARALCERAVPLTAGQLQSDYDEKMRKAAELEFEIMDDNLPDLVDSIHSGSGVFIDSTKRLH